MDYAELWVKQGVLPTTKDILDILQSNQAELEKPENENAKKVLLWYLDRWLPIVHGTEYWDDKYRHYKLQTDEIAFRDGVSRELCTVESEAFGLLVYDNCRNKWQNIFDLKKENEGMFLNEICVNGGISFCVLTLFCFYCYTGAVVPRTGNAAKDYEAKWTLTKEGQRRYGGWKPEAFDFFNELQQTLEALRQADAKNDKTWQKYCLNIVRDLHKKAPDDTEYNKKNSSKKAAKVPPPPPDPTKRRIKRRRLTNSPTTENSSNNGEGPPDNE